MDIVQGGDYGYIAARAPAGATCNARAILPNGHDAPGVKNPQIAGPDWTLSWLYPQPPTDEGTGLHVVTCSLNGLSGTYAVNFEVGL